MRRIISCLRISGIHFPTVDLNLTGRKRGGNKMLDSWQIGEVRDSEVTADRLRDWEKVAENVKHADGYLHEVERIHHIRDVTFL